MEIVLTLDVPGAHHELSRGDLEALADRPAAERAGRWAEGMTALPFSALLGLVLPDPEVDHATFHAMDGYAASIPLEQAATDGLLVVPTEGSGKPGVRLIVQQGATKCLNVKAVTRVELTAGPGKHTVDPNPHKPARVDGWDE